MRQEHKILEIGQERISFDIEISDLIDDELLSKLNFLEKESKYKHFSKIYVGGVAALSRQNREINPDWMSQSANSFREILYIPRKVKNKHLQQILTDYFGKNYTKEETEKYKSYLNVLYSLFSDIAHHFSGVTNVSEKCYEISEGFIIRANNLNKDTYFEAIRLYKQYLKLLVLTAIDMHRRIDECIKDNKREPGTIRIFINNSYDSKAYFFSKIDKTWLQWLWTNTFFSHLRNIKQNSEDKHNNYSELDYLRNMAENDPETVTEIILSIPVTVNNAVIVFYLIWIMSLLPAIQIKILINKMHKENWISLAKSFHVNGYNFTEIVQQIIDLNDSLTVLQLAQQLLSVKQKDNFEHKKSSYDIKSPFIVSHILECDIFKVISNIEKEYLEDAIKMMCDVIANSIGLGKTSKNDTFDYEDIFHFYDVDIFSLELDKIVDSRRQKKDLAAVVATIKKLIERISNIDTKSVNWFTYIKNLPSSRISWRLKLFSISQAPQKLRNELRISLFKIFEAEDSYNIEDDPEYQKLLKSCFAYLNQEDQKLYINMIFSHYPSKIKTYPEKLFYKDIAVELLSCITSYLSDEKKGEAENVFGKKVNKDYIPKPLIGEIRAGTVSYQSPENLDLYTVPEIIKNLKTEWTPQILEEKYTFDDFLKPRGAKGLSYALTIDVKLRLDEYLLRIKEFLDLKSIDILYLCAALRGIEELLRNKHSLTLVQARQLLTFFNDLSNNNDFLGIPEQKRYDLYTSSKWTEANRSSIDILVHLLIDKTIGKEIVKTESSIFIKLILYWFTFSHSPQTEEEKQSPQELHGIAINSVRGRAYEAFIEFVYKHKTLTENIKRIFTKALSDKSLAIKFCIGRYFSVLYYRDKKFIMELRDQTFPFDNPTNFQAAFSGFLSTDLYLDLFTKMDKYYSYAISLDTESNNNESGLYPSFDQLLATHLALAFVFADLKINNKLFMQFWNKKNAVRHKEFISFIGQSSLNNDHISEEWLAKKKVDKQKLIRFWNWCLKKTTDAEVLSGFGFWINPKKEVLDDKIAIRNIARTFRRTNGKINWDYGFLKRLPAFARADSIETLEAITYYLLDFDGKLNPNRHSPLYFDKEIKDALKYIYKSDSKQLKQKVIELINNLISLGGQVFWDLEEIIMNN